MSGVISRRRTAIVKSEVTVLLSEGGRYAELILKYRSVHFGLKQFLARYCVGAFAQAASELYDVKG